jgi:flagellar hook-length control protein FliK
MLNPVELGRVHFALSGSGDQMTIIISADNPSTQQLLQAHAAELQGELERAGLGLADLSFVSTGGDRGGNRGAFAQPQPEASSASHAEPPDDIQTPSPPPRTSTSGLDLRL